MITYSTPPLYRYAINLKLSQVLASTQINGVFPNIEDVMISSRDFTEFEEAVTSTTALAKQLTLSLNVAVQAEKYKLVSEVNPKISGTDTVSKEWADNELLKIWILDNADGVLLDGSMPAIGLAQLIEIDSPPVFIN